MSEANGQPDPFKPAPCTRWATPEDAHLDGYSRGLLVGLVMGALIAAAILPILYGLIRPTT